MHIEARSILDLLSEALANYGAAYAGCVLLLRAARRESAPELSLWPAPQGEGAHTPSPSRKQA